MPNKQTNYIALLRAVNLPGHNKVGMADLCGLLSSLGLKDGRSLLQSGNLVFRSDSGKSTHLERLLEDGAKKAKVAASETMGLVREAMKI